MRDFFNFLTQEKARGGVASFVSGVVANVMNAALIMAGMNPALSTALSMQIVGNLLTFFLDIMVAKRDFHGAHLPYRDLGTRFSWFLHSLVGPPIHKFIVACIIEGVVVFAGLKRAREYCDLHNIQFWMRDAILAGLVAALSFLLVMNVLRFNWVLDETPSITLDIVVLAWMGLSVLVLLLEESPPPV